MNQKQEGKKKKKKRQKYYLTASPCSQWPDVNYPADPETEQRDDGSNLRQTDLCLWMEQLELEHYNKVSALCFYAWIKKTMQAVMEHTRRQNKEIKVRRWVTASTSRRTVIQNSRSISLVTLCLVLKSLLGVNQLKCVGSQCLQKLSKFFSVNQDSVCACWKIRITCANYEYRYIIHLTCVVLLGCYEFESLI